MTTRTFPVPPATSQLARVVQTLCEHRDDARVEWIHTQGASLQLGNKAQVVLLVWDEANAHTFPERLETLMKQSAQGMLVVGLLGGSQEARKMLKSARPMITKVKVGQVHIDDHGGVWTRDASFMAEALDHLETTAPPSEAAWARLLQQSAASIANSDEKVHEARTFFHYINARRPFATYTLVALLLAVFGLEAAFGGTESSMVLLRMGALDPHRVQAGEVWRLFSCTFLHAGYLHVLFNTYVLWVLGSFLERLLGIWRFILLYVLSCLGASLVSMMFLEGFSVGASGGLWGLLGAEAVLAWRSQGLLPRAMIAGARRAAKFNLGINVLNSFRPHVDMWAHFGGGAVGAALLFAGVLTRGLPRLGELETQERLGDHRAVAIPASPQLKLAGGLAAFFLLLGLAFGLVKGQPWILQKPVELVQTPLPEFGISLALPPGLQQTLRTDGSAPTVQVGDLGLDLGAALITLFRGDFAEPAVLEREVAALLEQLKTAPEGARLKAGPEEIAIGGSRGITVRYAYENDLEEEVAFIFLKDLAVRSNTLRWPDFPKAVPLGYATKVLEGLKRLPEVSQPGT